MNARWHAAHPLARGATLKERTRWHVAHQKACACREMPASIRAALGLAAKPAPATAVSKRGPAGPAGPADSRFAAVVKALHGERGVTYGGKGFGSSALKVDGKIFAMRSSKGAFVVKLPKARVAALVADGKGEYFDPGRGRLMKEWLAVTAPKTAWLGLAREALAFGQRD